MLQSTVKAGRQPVERPIAQGIKTVDPHLKRRVRGVI